MLEDNDMRVDIPIRSAGATLQRVGPEAILYDRRNGRTHVINTSAARIWDLCDGRTNVEQIAGAFAAAYAMPTSEVYDDVLAILATFRELRVLE
jgi:PqqD family protein of HPr-rel-A system